MRVLLIVLLTAAAALGAFFVTRAVHHERAAPLAAHPTPQIARAAGESPADTTSSASPRPPTAAGVAGALANLLDAPGLGPRVRARIVAAASGAQLLDDSGATAAAPASTAKLLTAAALLSVRRPTDRLRTVVRAGPNATVVLVGGGDPTLTAAAPGKAGAYGSAARLSDLAQQVRAAHVQVRRIVVADALFTGPAVSPDWQAEDVPSDYGAAITAVMTDGGRASPHNEVRSAAPDLAAGRSFARLLGVPSAPVTRGAAGAGKQLAVVSSAPLGTLVRQMLRFSDNVIAECLSRQVALALHRPPSFTGAAAAIAAEVAKLGVDAGHGMVDASGLAPRDRLTPAVLVAVLRLAVRTPRLRDILDGMPVAGWSGTLSDRYVTGLSRAGAGVVRAKTGTLTGVSALAGLVHDRSGALLAFAVIADRAPDTDSAEAALDNVAGRLAECGCR